MPEVSENPSKTATQDKALATKPESQHLDLQDVLEVEIPEVLAALSKNQRKRLLSVMQAIKVSESHSGPIPRPGDIAEYNKHIPDGANRIMTMAEDQSKHRIEMEKIVVTKQQQQSTRGQIFGLIIAIFGISAGSIVAVMGHDAVGGAIAGTTVISLVYAFVTGRRQQRQPRDRP
jgi:uncharacterized membrane protein